MVLYGNIKRMISLYKKANKIIPVLKKTTGGLLYLLSGVSLAYLSYTHCVVLPELEVVLFTLFVLVFILMWRTFFLFAQKILGFSNYYRVKALSVLCLLLLATLIFKILGLICA